MSGHRDTKSGRDRLSTVIAGVIPGVIAGNSTIRPWLHRLRHQFDEEARFLRAWLGDPLKTGAIAPSGSKLALTMAGFVTVNSDLPVLELGPGTGAVTKALLDRGVAANRIISVEYNAGFCEHLRDQFPGVRIVQGDAYAIRQVLDEHACQPFDSIVSGLPLFTRPAPEREELVGACLEQTRIDGPFIQFSYALVPAIRPTDQLKVSSTGWIIMNIPPARVWTYRRTG